MGRLVNQHEQRLCYKEGNGSKTRKKLKKRNNVHYFRITRVISISSKDMLKYLLRLKTEELAGKHNFMRKGLKGRRRERKMQKFMKTVTHGNVIHLLHLNHIHEWNIDRMDYEKVTGMLYRHYNVSKLSLGRKFEEAVRQPGETWIAYAGRTLAMKRRYGEGCVSDEDVFIM